MPFGRIRAMSFFFFFFAIIITKKETMECEEKNKAAWGAQKGIKEEEEVGEFVSAYLKCDVSIVDDDLLSDAKLGHHDKVADANCGPVGSARLGRKGVDTTCSLGVLVDELHGDFFTLLELNRTRDTLTCTDIPKVARDHTGRDHREINR